MSYRSRGELDEAAKFLVRFRAGDMKETLANLLYDMEEIVAEYKIRLLDAEERIRELESEHE
jgi:hypothetical protein